MLLMPAALFHRQRVLLSLLQLQGGACTKISLLKQVFLLCREEAKQDIYDFHPYLFGPFSLTLYADLRALERRGYLRQTDEAVLLHKNDADSAERIGPELSAALSAVVDKYGKRTDSAMLREVYTRYPYFAIRNPRCGKRYAAADPQHDPLRQEPTIFSIGYEGKSIDRFLDELIVHNIHVLVDIRHNPKSMKYGFSFPKLRELCEARGIGYATIPALGIVSDKRQSLETPEDYVSLFEEYERTTLAVGNAYLEQIAGLLRAKKRIALMCFEKDVACCHRSKTSERLKQYCSNDYELIHL